MSSLRNAVKRKTHKERAQPAFRRQHGLLEKKKDYLLRARDYQKKKRRITALKRKAEFRNPDEFYFGMVNAKTKDGIHRKETEKVPTSVVKLIRSQNISYVEMLRSQEVKRIEKLKSNLHFVGNRASKPVNKHSLFLDDEDDVANFDKAQYFDTLPEFADRAFNRPRREDLAREKLVKSGEEDEKKGAGDSLKAALRKRKAAYSELQQRLDRHDLLKKAVQHMQVQKHLTGKGRRVKVKEAEHGNPAVFRWKKERKR